MSVFANIPSLTIENIACWPRGIVREFVPQQVGKLADCSTFSQFGGYFGGPDPDANEHRTRLTA